MIARLMAHWATVTVAAAWLTTHLRQSIPARGTPKFWTSWAYNIVAGVHPAKDSSA